MNYKSPLEQENYNRKLHSILTTYQEEEASYIQFSNRKIQTGSTNLAIQTPVTGYQETSAESILFLIKKKVGQEKPNQKIAPSTTQNSRRTSLLSFSNERNNIKMNALKNNFGNLREHRSQTQTIGDSGAETGKIFKTTSDIWEIVNNVKPKGNLERQIQQTPYNHQLRPSSRIIELNPMNQNNQVKSPAPVHQKKIDFSKQETTPNSQRISGKFSMGGEKRQSIDIIEDSSPPGGKFVGNGGLNTFAAEDGKISARKGSLLREQKLVNRINFHREKKSRKNQRQDMTGMDIDNYINSSCDKTPLEHHNANNLNQLPPNKANKSFLVKKGSVNHDLKVLKNKISDHKDHKPATGNLLGSARKLKSYLNRARAINNENIFNTQPITADGSKFVSKNDFYSNSNSQTPEKKRGRSFSREIQDSGSIRKCSNSRDSREIDIDIEAESIILKNDKTTYNDDRSISDIMSLKHGDKMGNSINYMSYDQKEKNSNEQYNINKFSFQSNDSVIEFSHKTKKRNY